MPFQCTLSDARKVLLSLTAIVALAGIDTAQADVLDDVKANGVVKCGVTLSAPGFSAENNEGKREGFDVDLCKAIAAATLGDETKIQLTPMDLKTAFAGLPTGVVDVLTHRFTWTQSRDVGGLKFPKVMFFDGQGFVVDKKSKANKIADLNNATICTLQGSTSELIVASYFGAHKLKYKIVTFASAEQAWDAFVGKRCDTVINDRSGLAARLAKLTNKDDYRVLAETVSNEPIGPIVAQGRSLHTERAGGGRRAWRHAGQRRHGEEFAESGRAASPGRHRRPRYQARCRQRLRLQSDQGRRQLWRSVGPQRRTQDSPATGAWTQCARRQWRLDDVDSHPLTAAGARRMRAHRNPPV